MSDDADADEQVMRRLAEPTPADAICQRQGAGGRSLSFVKESFVKWRLNGAAGMANWQADVTMGAAWARCVLTVQLPSGRLVMRAGISGFDTKNGSLARDDVNVVKSAATDAFKRAAWMYGIGADLRPDGVYGGAADDEDAHHQPAPREPGRDGRPDNRQGGGWGAGRPERREPQPPREAGGNGNGIDGPPRSGRALFAWAKAREEELGPGLIKALNQWAKARDFPFKMTEYSPEQVALAHAEAVDLIRAARSQGGEDEYRNEGS